MESNNSTQPEISVVVPCHNEQQTLPALTDAIRAALDPLNAAYEIVFTDDGSTDATWETLRRLHNADSRVRAQRFEKNAGQSAALWAGMIAARGRVIVTLDADMQNDPKDLPKFLAAIRDADCVCGNRIEARSRGDGVVKIASSRIANWVRNKVSDEHIADGGCCYRAFRRDCLAGVRPFRGFHRFLPTLIRMDGFRVSEIAIHHNPRRAGASHYGIWNRLFASFTDLLAVRWMKKRAIRHEIAERVR